MAAAGKGAERRVAPAACKLPVAKYLQIRNWLAERIASGEYAQGSQLPSEHDIMAAFSVSRVTARQAFDALRSMGLVEARRGRGYFVSRLLATASLERLQSFGEMMAPLGVETRSEVMELVEETADRDVAHRLVLETGAPVIRLARARIAGDVVVSIDVGFLPAAIGRRIMLLDLGRQDIYVLMERQLGIEVGYADVTLDVAPVPAPLAAPLGIERGSDAIRLARCTFANTGEAVMFEHIYARLDRLQFRARIPRW